MSIVDTKRNDAPFTDLVVEEIETTTVAPRVSILGAPLGVEVRESPSRRIARYFTALRQNSTMGHNGFMMQDRAVYDEFRVSAERQAMAK
jgi:hypothetical protein